MHLIVDIGNSSTKLAVYKDRKKISVSRLHELSCSELEKNLQGHKFKRAIISSVRKMPTFITDLLFTKIPLIHVLSYKSKLPFLIGYDTPGTLGTDRIAAVAGAFEIYPEADVLVIDAGTAITYDFLSANEFRGGNISPGISMRFKALHKFTGNLPLVSPDYNYKSPGRKTDDAIAAGVIDGVTYEINEYIRTFEKIQNEPKIILTGGDSGYIKDKIDAEFIYMPDLVLDGLNYILNYNAT